MLIQVDRGGSCAEPQRYHLEQPEGGTVQGASHLFGAFRGSELAAGTHLHQLHPFPRRGLAGIATRIVSYFLPVVPPVGASIRMSDYT